MSAVAFPAKWQVGLLAISLLCILVSADGLKMRLNLNNNKNCQIEGSQGKTVSANCPYRATVSSIDVYYVSSGSGCNSKCDIEHDEWVWVDWEHGGYYEEWFVLHHRSAAFTLDAFAGSQRSGQSANGWTSKLAVPTSRTTFGTAKTGCRRTRHRGRLTSMCG